MLKAIWMKSSGWLLTFMFAVSNTILNYLLSTGFFKIPSNIAVTIEPAAIESR